FSVNALVHIRIRPSSPTRRSSDLDRPGVERGEVSDLKEVKYPPTHVALEILDIHCGIMGPECGFYPLGPSEIGRASDGDPGPVKDRKSTRLNSSHVSISYAVFCLK